MKIITQRDRIRQSFECFVDNPKITTKWHYLLKDLDRETVAPEVIDKIFGDDGNTTTICSECGSKVTKVVGLGKDFEYDDFPAAYICLDCLKKAVAEMDKHEN